jgi:NADH:ubiquinone oxidoreductase subunit 6 (subunit J)
MRVLHAGSRAATPTAVTTSESTTESTTESQWGPWLWLAAGAGLFFAVPFVGTDMFALPRDLYYLVYITAVGAFFTAFVLNHRDRLAGSWQRHWRGSLLVGALAGAAVAGIVLSTAGTDHPDGWEWWFAIAWRGVVYGSADTLLLFVFPAAVAWLVMHGNRMGVVRKLGYAGLTLALSLLVSTSYHLGYVEYRDADLRSPVIGTALGNSAAVFTGNPVGAFVTHTAAHVTAVVHQYEGGPTRMLPPTEDD